MNKKTERVGSKINMSRRRFIKNGLALSTGVGTIGISTHAFAISTRDKVTRPNIIFLLSDDHRYDALGCMGNTIIQTPQLDQLARDGVLFKNNFCTTSICCASRASFFSGMYANTHGINEFNQDMSSSVLECTYPVQLRKQGYYVGFVGKFGVGNNMPSKHFDYWKGFPGQGKYFYEENGEKIHSSDLLCQQSLAFLDERPENQPFCLSLSYKSPHALDYDSRPFQAAPRFDSLYADVTFPHPPSATQQAYEQLPSFLHDSEGRKRWKQYYGDEETFQRNIKDYYRLITGLDETVGVLRSALKERGLAESTIIVYAGDNGYLIGDHGLEGKWYAYEESIRIPMIIYDPRQPDAAGRCVSEMTLNIDLAPTLLEMAGVGIPARIDGKSLCPLIRGEKIAWREDWFYSHYFKHPLIPKSEGIRMKRLKYIRWITGDPGYEELFDLEADPLEQNNIAGNTDFAPVLTDMRQRWKSYKQALPPAQT